MKKKIIKKEDYDEDITNVTSDDILLLIEEHNTICILTLA